METYTITPAGEALLQLLSAVPFVVFAIGIFLLFILAILMPYSFTRRPPSGCGGRIAEREL